MPTYEYECSRCGHRFEKFQAMSDRRVRKCPKCRGRVRRLIGAGAAVIVKGGRSGRSAAPCGLDAPCDACPYEE